MTDLERVVTLVGALALIANQSAVTDRGGQPNGLVRGAAIIFASYSFMDLYIGLKHPEKRSKPQRPAFVSGPDQKRRGVTQDRLDGSARQLGVSADGRLTSWVLRHGVNSDARRWRRRRDCADR